MWRWTTQLPIAHEIKPLIWEISNGDGYQDLVVTSWGNNTASIQLNNGDGTFPYSTDIAVGAGPLWVAAGGFNNDGIQDLVVAIPVSNSSRVSVLINNTPGSLRAG